MIKFECIIKKKYVAQSLQKVILYSLLYGLDHR